MKAAPKAAFFYPLFVLTPCLLNSVPPCEKKARPKPGFFSTINELSSVQGAPFVVNFLRSGTEPVSYAVVPDAVKSGGRAGNRLGEKVIGFFL